MKIAILGTGSVGRILAEKLGASNHEIYMGTRDVERSLSKTVEKNTNTSSLRSWLEENSYVQLSTFKEAVKKGGDLIVFAMNGLAALECLEMVGASLLEGKTMMDISNPLDFSNGFPPSLFINNTDSLGEQIQRAYPTLKVIKTLNTVSGPIMVNPQLIKGAHSVFVSGNDQTAKLLVTEVLESFGWEKGNIIDLGDITTARGTEMILPIWLRLYGKLQTPYFNFHVNMNSGV
ncbi:MAG: NAD(P)-binding domain-containing protein [Bacteroidota bacterium]